MGTDLKHDSCRNLFVGPGKIDSDKVKRMEALDATSGFRLLHCRGSLCEVYRMILYARDGSDHNIRRCYRFACSELVGLQRSLCVASRCIANIKSVMSGKEVVVNGHIPSQLLLKLSEPVQMLSALEMFWPTIAPNLHSRNTCKSALAKKLSPDARNKPDIIRELLRRYCERSDIMIILVRYSKDARGQSRPILSWSSRLGPSRRSSCRVSS
jgi:hypothetical protein